MTVKLEKFIQETVKPVKDPVNQQTGAGLQLSEYNEANQNISVEAPLNLGRSILLSVNYDGDRGVAYAKLYCMDDDKIYLWYDNTMHHPYCLTDLKEEELRLIDGLMSHPGLIGFKKTKKYSLLYDREFEMIKIEAKDPLSIGGKKTSIREIPGLRTWESNIRYHHCYIMDRSLTPGAVYYIRDGVLREELYNVTEEQLAEIKHLFKDDLSIYEELIRRYLPRIMDKIPELYRLALDIEVSTPVEDFIPEPETSEYPVISVALVDNKNNSRVLLLYNGQSKGVRPESFPQNVQLEFFDSELELIRKVFSYIREIPILITFNGDNFDLRYLYYRAKKLGINEGQIPIVLGDYADLKKGVHIDLYPFFNNVSIKGYAFGNRYIESTLNGIAKALLNEEKVQCDKFITDLSLMELAHYCWNDSKLTMDLTKFNNGLVIRLIILLMRISHLPIEDLTRTAVSAWIRNLMFYEHRQKNYLIPNQEDILKEKGEVHSQSIIKGKKFKGAIVIEPVKGVHFKVVVLDFASLYPSIIKKYNLSYETVLGFSHQ
ncbi:MAG: 3'-5' exonuclease [Candidatus Odinarchaeota archaeon]